MSKWTESKALDCLILCGAEKISAKTILKRDGWDGLQACSAMDYLKKLNYNFRLINNNSKKNKKTGDSVTDFKLKPEKRWRNVNKIAKIA